ELVDLRTAGDTNRRVDVAGSDRAEELLCVEGLDSDLDVGERLELLLELVRVIRVAYLTGLLGPLDGLDLTLGARGGHDGHPVREQEITTVSALDLDDVARGTELVDVGGEDQLHDPSTFLSSDEPTGAGLSRGHVSC